MLDAPGPREAGLETDQTIAVLYSLGVVETCDEIDECRLRAP